jgi:dephospho-CoA kinase
VTTPRVRRVALTGGIATGKSYVRAAFSRLGVPTLDADQLAREAVAPGTAGLASVIGRFGKGVLTPEGALDRPALARIVFRDLEARRALEAIVHPEVRRRTDDWFTALDPARHAYAIADIPLLFETDRDRDFDVVIVVACEAATQVRRLMTRDGLSETDALDRLAAQWPIDRKVGRADHVVRTDGTFDDTDRQVAALHARLCAGDPEL